MVWKTCGYCGRKITSDWNDQMPPSQNLAFSDSTGIYVLCPSCADTIYPFPNSKGRYSQEAWDAEYHRLALERASYLAHENRPRSA